MKPKLEFSKSKRKDPRKVFNVDLKLVASNAVYFQDEDAGKGDLFHNESIEKFIKNNTDGPQTENASKHNTEKQPRG